MTATNPSSLSLRHIFCSRLSAWPGCWWILYLCICYAKYRLQCKYSCFSIYLGEDFISSVVQKKKKKKQERFTDICKTESKLEYHKVFYCQSQTFFSLSRIKLIIIMECSKKKKKSQCQSSCYNILKTWWKLSVPEIKASSPVPLMASNDLGKPYSHIVSVDLVTRCGRCSHSEWWTLLSSFHGQRS